MTNAPETSKGLEDLNKRDPQTLLNQALTEIRRLSMFGSDPRSRTIAKLADTAMTLPTGGCVSPRSEEFLQHFDVFTLESALEAAREISTFQQQENKSIMTFTPQQQKIFGLLRFAGHAITLIAVLCVVLLQWNTSDALNELNETVSSVEQSIKQAALSQQPLSTDEVRAILTRPDGDCAKSYVQKSLAAGQPVLRGQISPNFGNDACSTSRALEQQRQALVTASDSTTEASK